MNWNQTKANWGSVCRAIMLKWHKFRENDFASIGGQRELLVITLKDKFAYTSIVPESKVDQFMHDLQD